VTSGAPSCVRPISAWSEQCILAAILTADVVG
jgi:hypothetical protein